jgi:hypothetical protein
MIKRHDTRYRHFLVSLPKKKTSMKKNVNQTIIKSNVLAVSGCVIFEKKKKKNRFCFVFSFRSYYLVHSGGGYHNNNNNNNNNHCVYE